VIIQVEYSCGKPDTSISITLRLGSDDRFQATGIEPVAEIEKSTVHIFNNTPAVIDSVLVHAVNRGLQFGIVFVFDWSPRGVKDVPRNYQQIPINRSPK